MRDTNTNFKVIKRIMNGELIRIDLIVLARLCDYLECEITDIFNYTKGNASLDEKVLDEMNASCEKLESISKSLAGVTVRCTYTPGKFIEEQIFQLAYVDENELGSAFSEAGGMNPEYKYQQNIDGIEKNLLASGYKCEREK